MIFKKEHQLSLVTATLIGLSSLPALAQTADTQTSYQNATISGENNQVIQITEQTIINYPESGSNNVPDTKKKKKYGLWGRNNQGRGNRNGQSNHPGRRR